MDKPTGFEKMEMFRQEYNTLLKCKSAIKSIDVDFFFEITSEMINYIEYLENR